MKKTLFSLAFLAVSGAYVAAANHLLGPPDKGPSSLATAALAVAPAIPSAAYSDTGPAAPPAPAVSSRSTALAATSLELSPPASQQTMAQAAPSIVPPLPRPRPLGPVATAVRPARQPVATVAVASTSGYRDGSYTGSDENAYYGRVQVQVTVAGQRITSVNVLDYPQDRRTSRYINSQALPLLKQEVIAADSAMIDTVSGATLTSEAYIRSLGNALSQAGAPNA